MEISEIFDHLSSKVGQISFRRTEDDRNIISKILDDLNSLNYRYPIVKYPNKAILLINKLCTYIASHDVVLIPKCCHLLVNLIKNQNIVVQGTTLNLAIEWYLEALKTNQKSVILDVLKALEALIRNNAINLIKFLDTIIKEIIKKISFNDDNSSILSNEVKLVALQCLEACTDVGDCKSLGNCDIFDSFEMCAEIFLRFLCAKNQMSYSPIRSKSLETCLLGLQNVIVIYPSYLPSKLGKILGVIKAYMLYNIKDIDVISPEKVLPCALSIPEIPSNFVREKTGGKVTRQRKHKTSCVNNKKKDKRNNEESHPEHLNQNSNTAYVPACLKLDHSSDTGVGSYQDMVSRLKTSDSDFSDTEGGSLAKLKHSCSKVRQSALNLFYHIVKQTEKSTIFTYWSSFIPESSSSGKHNLITCILKDPNVRARMCALNVLLIFLTSSKMYLLQAESSERTSSFTPFSVALGLALIELHKSICLALTDCSIPILTQALKCLAALVQATPYHRMKEGLITKIVRNVKELTYHKDACVQVTALIVMGCVLAYEPVLPEIKQCMLKIQKIDRSEDSTQRNKPNKAETPNINQDFDYAQFSSDEEEDALNLVEVDSIPWLVQRCLSNLGVKFEDDAPERIVPAPVKLESLQVLSAMSRNFFEYLMVSHLNYITKALEISLLDKYVDVRLHAGRAVDFLGQAMANFAKNEGSPAFLTFWQAMLNGPLILLLQDEEQSTLRAVGCDCIGSIGPHIFQQLPRDKQILCVTLLFACAKDEENTVRGAAVRALALCVLYPSLREDPGFVIDTSESILLALKDENLAVQIKASWSLGNLSEALVLNSKSTECIEELPDKTLHKLLQASIDSFSGMDKIKMNIVRGIGNLILLLDDRLLTKDEFRNACSQALNCLVKASTTGSNVKVRWNACYAIGNALKNSALYRYLDVNVWQPLVFNKLIELVVGYKNFKVRINAALALASPSSREYYGQYFIQIYTGLLKALENSQNMEDFTEYKHRDHLVEQICLSLGHLTTLIIKEDLISLQDPLNLYLDTFKTHMHKVLERVVPEKATELFSATCTLNALNSSGDIIGASGKQVLTCLKSVFFI